jgi:hypothetical protein
MTPLGSRFFSYFVAFPREKKPLRRLFCRFLSRDDRVIYCIICHSVGCLVTFSLEKRPLFRLLYRSHRRLHSREDAALSPALLVALSVASSNFPKRWRRFVCRFVGYPVSCFVAFLKRCGRFFGCFPSRDDDTLSAALSVTLSALSSLSLKRCGHFLGCSVAFP